MLFSIVLLWATYAWNEERNACMSFGLPTRCRQRMSATLRVFQFLVTKTNRGGWKMWGVSQNQGYLSEGVPITRAKVHLGLFGIP